MLSTSPVRPTGRPDLLYGLVSIPTPLAADGSRLSGGDTLRKDFHNNMHRSTDLYHLNKAIHRLYRRCMLAHCIQCSIQILSSLFPFFKPNWSTSCCRAFSTISRRM